MLHLIDTDNLSNEQIEQIFLDAKAFKNKELKEDLSDKLIINTFFENSTRTRTSFEIAAKRLKIEVVNLNLEKSSMEKGETLMDTLLNVCMMDPDAVIIRNKDNDIAYKLAEIDYTQVINAGAGNFAHPSQALLDLYTLKERLGSIKGKTIAIVGDIINSRVASSNIKLLRRMGMNVILVAPPEYVPETRLPRYNKIEEIIDRVDVIMSLRSQIERHVGKFKTKINYCIDKKLLGDRNIIVLHPGPVMRNIDISDEILNDERCLVLNQVNNGVYIRMAILKLILRG